MDHPTTCSSQTDDQTTRAFFQHSTAKRINTDAVIAAALQQQFPSLHLVIIPSYGADLLGYAARGHATFSPLEPRTGSKDIPSDLIWKRYVPPSRRLDGNPGGLAHDIHYGKFIYRWENEEFVLYVVDGRDGSSSYPEVRNYYLLTTDTCKADALILAAGQWTNELRQEVWVFDGGMWRKSAELYQSVMKSSWDAVILDPAMKEAIIRDHLSFFDSRETYKQLKVPWKRGLIYYGPPGNGKTISIKAMMNTFYSRKDPIPAMYVRNFVSWGGPEAAVAMIFEKARANAPCYLIFEDLDSLVTDGVRSYFLNEIDGLKNNDGIFIVGSTNHLDRLDPGIAKKRPSRFDRQYLFPDPNHEERVAYCHFWQKKLADNRDIAFPDELCSAVADITSDFSFAYIQEAFVAALLALARDKDEHLNLDNDEYDDGWVLTKSVDDDLSDLPLWVEMQKQVKILRESMKRDKTSTLLSR